MTQAGPEAPRTRLLDLLRLKAFEKREVTLSSGKKSDFYIDGKQVTLDAEGAYLTGKLLFDLIRTTSPGVRAIGGLTLGADPLVTAISVVSFLEGSPIRAFIVRKEAKSHGTSAWIEGVKGLTRGAPVVIVEDVVTTGESAMKAIRRTEEAGFIVAGVYALVDRSEGGADHLRTSGYTLRSLFSRQDFL